jgi:Flp pilus assembly protein TadD
MRRLIPLLLALFLLTVSTTRAQTGTSSGSGAQAGEALRNGTEAIRAGRFAEAERWFHAAVKENPGNPAAHLELGVAELRLGKPADAASALQQAIALDPQLPGANLFLGISYAQINRLDAAAASLQQEIDLDPKNAEAEMWLGVVELQAGHPEKATGPLDRAAELSPNDLNILEYRGKAHSDVAHDSYARMTLIDPTSWHVHKVEGQLYAMQDKYKEATAEFNEAIHGAPNNSDLYEELGNAYRKSGALDLAQQAFRKEMGLSPNNPIAMYNVATIDIERNEAESGVPLLLKVIANYANAPAAYYFLGLGQSQLGKPSEAVVSLEKARTMHPEPELAPRIEYELSRVYRKLGRTADSERAVREYTRLKALDMKRNPVNQQSQPVGSRPGDAQAAEPQAKN